MMSDSKAIKLSLRLDADVHFALRQEAKTRGIELSDHIQRVLTQHLLRERLLDEGAGTEKMKMWELIDSAVDIARKIRSEGDFGTAITLKTFQRCMEDKIWASDYATYVKDNPYKHGNPRKSPINKEIGFRIREAVGGKVVKLSNGKPEKCPVVGEVIQSYTPMTVDV